MDIKKDYGANLNISFVSRAGNGGTYELGVNIKDTEGVKLSGECSGATTTMLKDVEALATDLYRKYALQHIASTVKKAKDAPAAKSDSKPKPDIEKLKRENERLRRELETYQAKESLDTFEKNVREMEKAGKKREPARKDDSDLFEDIEDILFGGLLF